VGEKGKGRYGEIGEGGLEVVKRMVKELEFSFGSFLQKRGQYWVSQQDRDKFVSFIYYFFFILL
jgi:hypothetical protein